MPKLLCALLPLVLGAFLYGCNESGDGNTAVSDSRVTSIGSGTAGAETTGQAAGMAAATDAASGTLDFAEATHLVFMREEEKLARDIYLTFAQWYPDQATFRDISESEQTHTDVMRDQLAKFGIPDPDPDANNLPASIGVFTSGEYGAYMTQTFAQLSAQGAQSEVAALYVGALIEELDMHDIVKCPDEIVQMDNGIGADGCGLDYTDEQALKTAYTSLVEASKSHLRAFVKQIENVIGEGKYEAQFLTQKEVNEILGR